MFITARTRNLIMCWERTRTGCSSFRQRFQDPLTIIYPGTARRACLPPLWRLFFCILQHQLLSFAKMDNASPLPQTTAHCTGSVTFEKSGFRHPDSLFFVSFIGFRYQKECYCCACRLMFPICLLNFLSKTFMPINVWLFWCRAAMCFVRFIKQFVTFRCCW